MTKRNKGVTLTEVLVSIVVLGIVFACVFSILSVTNKLSISNERKINSLTEVESLLELFSSNPQNFKENMQKIYNLSPNEVDGISKYKLYYTTAFIRKTNNESTPFYLDISYRVIDSTYRIDIGIYHNNTLQSYGDNALFTFVIIK